MSVLPVPPAQTDCVDHADWIELEAIFSKDGTSSLQTLASQLRISGTTDALTFDEDDPHDAGGEQSYQVAADAWEEIERRYSYCGEDDGAYPFEVTQSSITLKDGWRSSVYVFQSLLSEFGNDAGVKSKPERLFEQISARAAHAYFGGNTVCRYRCFGSPRQDGSNFVDALSALCSELREGSVRLSDPHIKNQKDGKLDVVVWRPFRDKRRSQLIGFGQFATGKKLDDQKLSELDPLSFRESWMDSDGLYPPPVRMFFAPHCIYQSHWRRTSINAGIVFDRCRISELTHPLESDLAAASKEWSSSVIQKLGGDR